MQVSCKKLNIKYFVILFVFLVLSKQGSFKIHIIKTASSLFAQIQLAKFEKNIKLFLINTFVQIMTAAPCRQPISAGKSQSRPVFLRR